MPPPSAFSCRRRRFATQMQRSQRGLAAFGNDPERCSHKGTKMRRRARRGRSSPKTSWLCVRTRFFCCSRLWLIRGLCSRQTKPMRRVSSLKCQVFSRRGAKHAKRSQFAGGGGDGNLRSEKELREHERLGPGGKRSQWAEFAVGGAWCSGGETSSARNEANWVRLEFQASSQEEAGCGVLGLHTLRTWHFKLAPISLEKTARCGRMVLLPGRFPRVMGHLG